MMYFYNTAIDQKSTSFVWHQMSQKGKPYKTFYCKQDSRIKQFFFHVNMAKLCGIQWNSHAEIPK